MLTKNTGRRKSIFNVPKPALPFCGVARGDWSAVLIGATAQRMVSPIPLSPKAIWEKTDNKKQLAFLPKRKRRLSGKPFLIFFVSRETS